MKIQSSAVGMASTHDYQHYERKESASMISTAEQAATLEFSSQGASLAEQMKEEQIRIQEEEKKQQEENQQKALQNMAERMQEAAKNRKTEPDVQDSYKIKMELLKKMLEAVSKVQKGKGSLSDIKSLSQQYKSSEAFSWNSSGVLKLANSGTNLSGQGATAWKKTTVTSSFVTETEHTAFQAGGIVKTADGREINFGVTVEMSRGFAARFDSIVQEDYIMTDPLVINLDSNIASVTDQKFLFDIDSDGKQENISFAGPGSGFLALDKNKDGKINDGSELFGTKSGDGFKDLAAYDKDRNGWIDENDDIFNDLKIWTKDSQGNDHLMSLKEAGVGAIYLGSAETEFSLKNDQYQTNGAIRRTGIYLKESGEAGTMQHVDLAV